MINSYLDKKLFEISHSVDEHPKQNEFFMHAHEHYELLLFISGDVTYLVEGELYNPKPYDILIFNIAETHKVIINSDKLYERTVLKMDKNLFSSIDPEGKLFYPFSSRKHGQNNLIVSSRFSDNLWRFCLDRLQLEEKSILQCLSNILPLLNEICEITQNIDGTSHSETLSGNILKFVNDNITSQLSPEEISKKFFISRTTLYSLFKKSTGTTFHDYVTAKRLIIARELLRLGNKPTYVATYCGFTEYTTFFRLYKKRFNQSPREINKKYSSFIYKDI